MTDLSAAILKALAGSSAQKPVNTDAITSQLADTGRVLLSSELLDALDDLVARRAINTARISADGAAWRDVYWPTGVPPAPMPRGITINKHTQADARAAHEAQARAESSREGLSTQAGAGAASTPLKSPLAPLCKGGKNSKESDMPRIAKPAKPAKTQAAQTQAAQTRAAQPAGKLSKPYIKAANGAVIAEALAALAGRTRETAMTTDEVLALCPSAASVGSLRSALRGLVVKGQVMTDSLKVRRKLRYVWWPAALNDGHEKNLAALKRLGGDESAQASAVAADPVAKAAEALDLDAPGTTRFALWDDGQLLVTAGDDLIVLDAGSTRRLADFLESCMGVVA